MNKSPQTENICLVSVNSNMNPVKKLLLSVNPAELLTLFIFCVQSMEPLKERNVKL